MRCAIAKSLPRGDGPARGAAPLERGVVEVRGIAGGTLNRGEDRLREVGIELHLSATDVAVHVPVRDDLLQVIGLSPIHPMMVGGEPKLLEKIEGAIDR